MVLAVEHRLQIVIHVRETLHLNVSQVVHVSKLVAHRQTPHADVLLDILEAALYQAFYQILIRNIIDRPGVLHRLQRYVVGVNVIQHLPEHLGVDVRNDDFTREHVPKQHPLEHGTAACQVDPVGWEVFVFYFERAVGVFLVFVKFDQSFFIRIHDPRFDENVTGPLHLETK